MVLWSMKHLLDVVRVGARNSLTWLINTPRTCVYSVFEIYWVSSITDNGQKPSILAIFRPPEGRNLINMAKNQLIWIWRITYPVYTTCLKRIEWSVFQIRVKNTNFIHFKWFWSHQQAEIGPTWPKIDSVLTTHQIGLHTKCKVEWVREGVPDEI